MHSVTLLGVHAFDASTLADVLETKASPWLPRREPRYFDPESFEAGPAPHRRVLSGSRVDRAYPYADVQVTTERLEAHDVRVRYRAQPGAMAPRDCHRSPSFWGEWRLRSVV